MPPLPVWFTGRDAVTRFLARRAFAKPGDMVLVPTAANGQPAVAEYRRAADNVIRAHSIHLREPGLTCAGPAAVRSALVEQLVYQRGARHGEPVSLDLVSAPARPWRCGATIN